MVQIKLSIPFILAAAAAIAPIVAQPVPPQSDTSVDIPSVQIRHRHPNREHHHEHREHERGRGHRGESHERSRGHRGESRERGHRGESHGRGHRGHRGESHGRGHHRGHRGESRERRHEHGRKERHDHRRVAVPTDDAPKHDRREFVEFEERDLAGERKLYQSYERKIAKLEKRDKPLTRQHDTLVGENKHFWKVVQGFKNDRGLRNQEFHHEQAIKRRRRTERDLEKTDKKLSGEKLEGHKEVLKTKSKGSTRTVATEKKSTSPVVATKGSPVVASKGKGKLSARDFDDDLFERDFEEVEFDARDFDDELYLD